MLSIVITSLPNAIYKVVIKEIVSIKPGTIKLFTSINPSVPLSKKNKDIQSIIKVPTIFGISKN